MSEVVSERSRTIVKTKVLFMIHDLGHGGAEKVLVNLVNNMDPARFDISVVALFGGGVNEQFLKPHVRFRSVWKKAVRGNSHLMKLLTPQQLHRICVKEHYDIEVSYLEGPSARVISGCTDPDTKRVAWIHCTMQSDKDVAQGFRGYREACACYARFDRLAFVSESVRNVFCGLCPVEKPAEVIYNTNESDRILQLAKQNVEEDLFSQEEYKLVCMGRLIPVKGYDRMIRIHERLRRDGYPVHTYILGEGKLRNELEAVTAQRGMTQSFTFLGYQENPYRFMAQCDLFVCSSHSEGFSTAATEALILGIPVCTTEVSGMREMLGEHNEYGIVTDNNTEALYEGMKRLLDDPQLLAHYKEMASERGKTFSTERTVQAVEKMLTELKENG